MAITFEETVQTVLNLVRQKEQLEAENKALKEHIVKLMSPVANVREPDAIVNTKPKLQEVK